MAGTTQRPLCITPHSTGMECTQKGNALDSHRLLHIPLCAIYAQCSTTHLALEFTYQKQHFSDLLGHDHTYPWTFGISNTFSILLASPHKSAS